MFTPCGSISIARPALPDFAMRYLSDRLYTSAPRGDPTHRQPYPCTSAAHHLSIVTRSRRHLVHAQVNKADGCGANEQQKQQKQQTQQKQQKQQKWQKWQKQKHTGGGKTRVSTQELKANATQPARQDVKGAARRS